MNMLTCVVTVYTRDYMEKKVNKEISEKEKEGWFLRGTPIPVSNDCVMLTFEKPENNYSEISQDE